MNIASMAAAWRRAHNQARDNDVVTTDAAHAHQLGLPTLAALLDLLALVDSPRTNPYISREEVATHLRPIIALALGEGQRRIEAATGEWIELPGLVATPALIVEDLARGGK